MYEKKSRPPAGNHVFALRLLKHFLVAMALVCGSLAIGMAGYMYFERLSAIDAFLNTAMLLGGMGPVDAPKTNAGKLFAGLFALYAGLVFIVSAALIFTPFFHRVLHLFHWDAK